MTSQTSNRGLTRNEIQSDFQENNFIDRLKLRFVEFDQRRLQRLVGRAIIPEEIAVESKNKKPEIECFDHPSRELAPLSSRDMISSGIATSKANTHRGLNEEQRIQSPDASSGKKYSLNKKGATSHRDSTEKRSTMREEVQDNSLSPEEYNL